MSAACGNCGATVSAAWKDRRVADGPTVGDDPRWDRRRRARQLWRAEYVSRHFDWEAYGETEGEARLVLLALWNAETCVPYDSVEAMAEDGVNCYRVGPGLAYKDREPVELVGS